MRKNRAIRARKQHLRKQIREQDVKMAALKAKEAALEADLKLTETALDLLNALAKIVKPE